MLSQNTGTLSYYFILHILLLFDNVIWIWICISLNLVISMHGKLVYLIFFFFADHLYSVD